MATVRKRKWIHNGKEAEAWVVSYTDTEGKRRQQTFERKRDADKRRVEVEGEISTGSHVATSQTVTFAVAVDLFVAECDRRARLGDVTRGTARNYRMRLAGICTPKLGRLKLSELRADQVSRFIEALREEYAASTIHGVHQAISALLDYAAKAKLIRRNFLRDEKVKLPRLQRRTDIPSKADLVALLDAAATLKPEQNLLSYANTKLQIALSLFSGMRPGEILGLQWENIDFANRVVKVRHSNSKTDGLKAPKSIAGIRDVPLSEPMFAALEDVATVWAIRDQCWTGKSAQSSQNVVNQRIRRAWDRRDAAPIVIAPRTGFVVLSKHGTPLTAEAIRHNWRNVMQLAGLGEMSPSGLWKPAFTPHALRHAAVSLMIEEGLPAMNLQRVIGHASSRTTFDVYGHLFPEDQRIADTANRIAATLGAARLQHDPKAA